MRVTILADDLTGACDTGALFTGGGPVAVSVSPSTPHPTQEVLVLDTESRSLPPPAAARRIEDAVAALPPGRRIGRIFKKLDSTLRGSAGAEVEALLEVTGIAAGLVCPAFPEQGRVVVERILKVDGRPVHTTAVGADPAFRASSSDVMEILTSEVRRPVRWLPLRDVREGVRPVLNVLHRSAGALVAADAETDEDLAVLVEAALSCSPAPVLAGSAGLARALASRLGYAGAPTALPTGSAWLVIAGSLHPASLAQIRALELVGIGGERLAPGEALPPVARRRVVEAIRSGRPALVTVAAPPAPTSAVDRSRTAAGLGEAVVRVLEMVRPSLLVLVGGDTAVAVFRALKADLIELTGAPESGVAVGRLRGGLADRLPLLTKAGGLGPPDLFLSLSRRLPA